MKSTFPVQAGRLNMPPRKGIDPYIGPGRRKNEFVIPFDIGRVLNLFPVGREIAPKLPLALSPGDARRGEDRSL